MRIYFWHTRHAGRVLSIAGRTGRVSLGSEKAPYHRSHSCKTPASKKPYCVIIRAVTSTDFRNPLTGPPNSNHIRLTERFASPYGALGFHVFMGSDSPPGPSSVSWQVVLLLVSNQTIFMQIKRRSKIITRAGVKYVLSNTNTNTNTFFSEFQIQIQIQIHRQKSDQIQIQIQIQPIKYKYKYTLRPRQNWRHFTDDILKFILL